MKNKHLLATALLAVAMTSCGTGGGQQNGKKFDPSDKESVMTDSERAQAIAEMHASLDVNIDSILNFTGVKFSVLPPSTGDGVSPAASERLSTRIINICARNGIGGLSVNPVLGLVTKADLMESSVTNTAPQNTVVKYELTLYCGNFITNDIYGSATVSLTGVGSNVETATLQAFSGLKETTSLKELFRKSADSAMIWYNNQSNIAMSVDKAVSDQNYALAMALLSSVPAQASTHEYAVRRNAAVCDLFFQSKANELYSQMKAAIAASDGKYNPEAGAYYSLIPHNTKIWTLADKVFTEYDKAVEANRRDAIARAHEADNRDAANAQLIAMERLQVEKIKAPFEAQATIAQINADARVAVAQANAEGKKNANTGGFLGLGKLWDGSFNLVNRLFEDNDD